MLVWGNKLRCSVWGTSYDARIGEHTLGDTPGNQKYLIKRRWQENRDTAAQRRRHPEVHVTKISAPA